LTEIMQIAGNTGNIAYQHPHDAGADLKSCEDTIIPANGHALVHTGVYAAIPCNHVGLVCPRSGLALKQGLTVLNAPGIIDSNYRGELCVILHNTSERAVEITAGQRIAQLVVTPVEHVKIIPVSQLREDTERGGNGFGSTGE
jgi:dUTP pyrophosphatase